MPNDRNSYWLRMRLRQAVCGIFALSISCSSGLKANKSGRPDGAGQNAPIIENDAGPDGNGAKIDAATDRIVRDVVAEQDGPLPGTGALALGNLLPLAGDRDSPNLGCDA